MRVKKASLETLFFQELRAINDYFELEYQLYYWRTSNKIEIDFVAYEERGIHAFEIKRSANVQSADFRGLQAFQRDYPMAKCYLLYNGKRREYHGNIQLVSYEEVILQLKEILEVSV